jgi:hypothetical protein
MTFRNKETVEEVTINSQSILKENSNIINEENIYLLLFYSLL